MKPTPWFRRLTISAFLVGLWAEAAGAQFYGGLGTNWYGQAGIPYGSPYTPGGPGFDLYGNVYLPGYLDAVPPPSSYLAPSLSYNPNPYTPFPRSSAYELPWYSFNPNSYTYDLRAYGYSFLPPPVVYPVAPYYYTPYSYYIGRRPYRWRGPYHAMTLEQYLIKSQHGPTRVRDIVPGVPGLSG